MITTLMTLYLQCVSIVGLMEVESDKVHGSQTITLQDLITQQGLNYGVCYTDDLLYRPATGTTLEVKYPEDVWSIAKIYNAYFRCPKCDSGQVEATMSPVGREKMFVFDCHCMGCKAKWRVKIPVILEVEE